MPPKEIHEYIVETFGKGSPSYSTVKKWAAELRWLRQEIKRKRRGKLTRSVLLLQDNAPAHTSQVAMAAATECEFEILPHPPYFPDMAPSDFYLFPKLKSHLRGTQYGSNEDVIAAVNEYLGDQEKAFYF